MSNKLVLLIHQVKCVDEMGGAWREKFGNDEIYLGGLLTETGKEVVKKNFFSVYPHFDDGDVKVYNPPLIFCEFDLNKPGNWPRVYSVGLQLAEKQHGGMDGTLNKYLQLIKDKLGIAAIGAATLAKVPWAAPAIQAVLERVLAEAEDKMFSVKTAEVQIASPNHNWNGSLTSSPESLVFRGHDGIYSLTYSWKLY
ncbi:MAG: hypothetical protein WAU15_09195 [Nitrosomonas sp.]